MAIRRKIRTATTTNTEKESIIASRILLNLPNIVISRFFIIYFSLEYSFGVIPVLFLNAMLK